MFWSSDRYGWTTPEIAGMRATATASPNQVAQPVVDLILER